MIPPGVLNGGWVTVDAQGSKGEVTHTWQINIDKSLLSLSQISVYWQWWKCTETMPWLCNSLVSISHCSSLKLKKMLVFLQNISNHIKSSYDNYQNLKILIEPGECTLNTIEKKCQVRQTCQIYDWLNI